MPHRTVPDTRKHMARTITKPYRRKLSREDTATATILLTKDRWPMFPPPMTEFSVRVGSRRFATRIVPEDCDCVLPPHQHYHFEMGHFCYLLDFSAGATVEIAREADAYVVRNG